MAPKAKAKGKAKVKAKSRSGARASGTTPVVLIDFWRGRALRAEAALFALQRDHQPLLQLALQPPAEAAPLSPVALPAPQQLTPSQVLEHLRDLSRMDAAHVVARLRQYHSL